MILVDNFIDGDLLEGFNNPQLWYGQVLKYRWYDKGEPINHFEVFIKHAAEWLQIFDKHEGFEYWVLCNRENDATDWHIDTDELHKEDRPSNSTIFYGYPHNMWGGMLEFACEASKSEVERFAPTFNRLIFNSDPEREHRVTRVWTGERMSLIFSGWDTKPKLFADKDEVTWAEIKEKLNDASNTY